MILRRERLARRRDEPPGGGEARERLRAADLVNDVAIDLQKADAIAEVLDQVIVPDAVE